MYATAADVLDKGQLIVFNYMMSESDSLIIYLLDYVRQKKEELIRKEELLGYLLTIW